MKSDLSSRRRKVERRLIYTLLVLPAAAVLALFGLHLGVDIEQVTFTTKDDVRIRGCLISPEGRSSERLPAAVFCHGLLASKELYIHGERRLARSGIRVLAVDLRGHGQSGGFSDFGKSESKDALAGVNYLLTRPDVDPGRISLVGHSLGGIIVTRAGCEDAGRTVRAVAGVYCWTGLQGAIESIFGPLDQGFIGNLWHSFAWEHSFPLTEPELRARDVIPLLSPERRPPNYLLIHGTREVLTTEDKARGLVARAAGVEKVKPGVILGDPLKLTARQFTLVGGGHGFEAVNPAAYRHIENWFSKCLDADIKFAGFDRGLGIFSIAALLALAAAIYIYGLIRVWFSLRVPTKDEKPAEKFMTRWQVVLASTALIALSAPAFRLAEKFGAPLLARTWFGDVLGTYALMRIILCLPLLAILALIYRKRFLEFWRRLIPGLPSWNEWGLGLAPVIWLAVSLSFLGLFLWIPPALPKHYLSFLILFIVLFLHYVIEEGVFRGVIQRNMGKGPNRRIAGLTGLVGGLGFSAAFIACFPSPTYTIHLPSMSLPMLPLVLIIFPIIYYTHSLLTTYLYRRTSNILIPAASMALLLAWLFTAFGVRAA
jgi:pimeloyl-ACP methyl ester carboxylesterase